MEAIRPLRKHISLGLLVILIGLFANYFASVYAFERASNSVTDIVLSNIPVFDVDMMFVWGPFVFWIIALILALRYPKRIPFALESIGSILIVRAVFITLTHIGPFPDHQVVVDNFFTLFSSGSDLFFSGHTALPFMIALVFWDKFYYRIFFVFSAIFFAAIVLLGHLHYSIDVAAAFFITYTTFKMAEKIFKRDRNLFEVNG